MPDMRDAIDAAKRKVTSNPSQNPSIPTGGGDLEMSSTALGQALDAQAVEAGRLLANRYSQVLHMSFGAQIATNLGLTDDFCKAFHINSTDLPIEMINDQAALLRGAPNIYKALPPGAVGLA